MANLHFELVTPEKRVRSEEVFMVVVPGTEGDFGVLADHAPVMSSIRSGARRSGFLIARQRQSNIRSFAPD